MKQISQPFRGTEFSNRGLSPLTRIGWFRHQLREILMANQDDAAADAIHALAGDTAQAWEAFIRMAGAQVWAASLRAAPRRSQAEALFADLTSRLYQDRLALGARLTASRLPNGATFLAREIDGLIGAWLVELFRDGAAEAADVLARVFFADIKAWVQRAAPPGAQAGVEDRVQDVFAALLENGGRRVAAFRGGGPFRAFLRTVVVNLAAESARHEHGRYRPGTSPGAVVGRPRLVSLNDDDHPLDPADDRDDPEAALLALEELLARTEREGAVLNALRRLPAESRRVLEARFLEGRKPREIAEMTGRDVKEVYRILERTLAQLKQVLV